MIVGQNSLLNQYVPTFYIRDPLDGQALVYDSVRKAFINTNASGGGTGAQRLGELLNVSGVVDNPLAVDNGQALVFNSLTELWQNAYVDYNTLLHKPDSSVFNFAGLSDTAKPTVPDGYVLWNALGTELIYSTTIPGSAVSGTVAIVNGGTGANNATDAINALVPSQTGNAGKVLSSDGVDLMWLSTGGVGTVTSVGISVANGITVISGSPVTAAGVIDLGLGAITPSSVAATGTVIGSNLSGNNTGDQTITLTGAVTGTGTGTFTTALSATGVIAGSYVNPNLAVGLDGRITTISNGVSGAGITEIVVFKYSPGAVGNFSAPDAIYSTTPNVTPVITDTTQCVVTYSFVGKTHPPKSILTYGQVCSLNEFQIKAITSLPSSKVSGGGSISNPDIVNGIFSPTNLVTLQTRMADTGASAGIGQRAFLMVVFSF